MAHWIFQSKPGTGLDPRRCVKRYRSRIAAGDDIAFWQTGGVGLVGLGAIAGPPELDAEAGWTAPITLLRVFPEAPVPRAALLADPDFADSAILRMPGAASPFPVTGTEWAAILRHTAGR
ncbi:hypothetical protein ACIA8K_20785 [Catenuloplanes sp. NPDC051500]|uniref:hypothetical protein n=1 Tax=Catenuloplanes sp. NPDC051500 TaxID=3363959 RepID=UPI0037A1906F